MARSFEYTVLTLPLDVPGEQALEAANEYGAQGWELVGFDWQAGKFIFKREKPPVPETL